MERITEKQLQHVVDRINSVTKSPMESWSKKGNKYTSNAGNYHLSGAYGGVSLHRMGNEAGGIEDVFRCGHVTKRELYNRMQAFLDGLSAKAA